MINRCLMSTAVISLVLGLAACSSDDGASTPEASAGASWAGGVCSAMTDLETSLKALGQGLDVSVGSGDDVEQLKTQVGEQVDAVKADLDALASAASDVPADASSDVTAEASELQTQRADLEASVGDVEAAISAVADADSAPALATSVASATTAVRTANDDLVAYVSSLESAASSGADSVQAAFDQAPECAAYTTS
jgi:predicted  nucleic acid-binding Zn-ribbon protein